MIDFSDPTRIFGWLAVTLSLSYKFPQIYKLWKLGDIRGISVESQLIQVVSYLFYIIHGNVIGDPPIIILGCSSLIQSVVLVGQYFYIAKGYQKRTKIGPDDKDDSLALDDKNSKHLIKDIETG